LRLLVARVDGQTKAVLYKPVAAGSSAERRIVFTSPVGEVTFDLVREVSSEASLQQSQGMYTIKVPLSLLGWSQSPASATGPTSASCAATARKRCSAPTGTIATPPL
jgi:hypothetical protein